MGVSAEWAQSKQTSWLRSRVKEVTVCIREAESLSNAPVILSLYKELALLRTKLNSKDTTPKVTIEDIKQQVIIAQIIGCQPLKSDSRIDWYKCVSHNDTEPSMAVYREQNMAYCYACNFSGSVIDVYMAINSVDLKQAIKELSIKV